MVQLTLILDNIRSAHNVGAILRTANATGVVRVFCCGITPYPRQPNDTRDPVVSGRHLREIAKTALGAEATIHVEHYDNTEAGITVARAKGCTIYGLEQAMDSHNIFTASIASPAALVLGREVDGIPSNILALCDMVLEIPQHGDKESLNVSVASGIAMYALRNSDLDIQRARHAEPT